MLCKIIVHQKRTTFIYKVVLFYLLILFLGKNYPDSPYLDIYKDNSKHLIFIVGPEVTNSGNFSGFKEYIKYLRDIGISVILIESFGNYNLEERKILRKIILDYSNKISNIIFLTLSGGIKNNKGEVISYLTKEKLENILQGENDKTNLKGQMLKIAKLVSDLVKEDISKLTIANIGGLKEELEGFGSGTMIVDIYKAKFKKLRNKELFNVIYEKNLNNKDWKERSDEEKDEIFNNYIILEIDGTILGGYALSDYEKYGKKGKLLECLFTTKIGSGLGYVLGEEFKKHKTIFTYSHEKRFFNNLGFIEIEGEKSKSGADLYVYYSTNTTGL